VDDNEDEVQWNQVLLSVDSQIKRRKEEEKRRTVEREALINPKRKKI
jgi:hypothetical protein